MKVQFMRLSEILGGANRGIEYYSQRRLGVICFAFRLRLWAYPTIAHIFIVINVWILLDLNGWGIRSS